MRVLHRRTVTILVGLLVFGLVSVVNAPGALAAAETKYGHRISWEAGGMGIGPVPLSAHCVGNAWWVATRENGLIRYGVQWIATRCRQSLDAADESDRRPYEVRGASEGGSVCSRGGGRTTVSERDGNLTLYEWKETGETLWLGYEDDPSDDVVTPVPGLASLCVPTMIWVDRNGRSGYDFAVNLGLRPTFGESSHEGVCEVGMPSGSITALPSPVRPPPFNPALYMKRLAEVEFSDQASGWWRLLFVYRKADGTITTSAPTGRIQGGKSGMHDLGAGVASHEFGDLDWTSPTTVAGYGELVGYQLIASPAGDDHFTIGGNTPQAGGVGSTDPSSCVFYMGEQLFDDETTNEDTPWSPAAGAIGTDLPPLPEDPGPSEEPPTEDEVLGPDDRCEFSFDDPSTWASGALCGVVSVLMKILGALLDLASAVLGLPAKILDGLAALFMPDASVIAGQTETLQQAWSDSTPGGYADDVGVVFGAVNFSEAGSCRGPTMEIPYGGEFAPLNACGDAGEIAGVVRGGMTAFIWLGAGLVVMRLVGSSIGLNMEGFGRESST